MKVSVAVLVLVAISVVSCAEEKYTTKYDNIDVDQILKSDRLTTNYLNCLLDKGKCSPDAAELKKVLPDALKTSCSKCTDKQKDGAKKIIGYLIKNRREWWEQLSKKYDPQGIYMKKYEQELKKQGVVA